MAGVRRYEDLIVWQLCERLKDGVFAFTSNPPAKLDFKYCDQIRDSSRSSSRNIAEGFGRYGPKDFRNFVRIAAGSLHETKNHLREGHCRGYLSSSDFEHLFRICLRAIKAANRLMAYLKHAKAPIPYDRPVSLTRPDEEFGSRTKRNASQPKTLDTTPEAAGLSEPEEP